MEAERQTKMASSLPIVGVLLVIAGAYCVSRSQLKSSRPEAPAGLKHPVTEKDKIEARLWQDPFKAVYDHRQAKRSEEKKDPCEPAVYQLSGQIDRLIKEYTASASNAVRGFVENVKAQLKPYVSNKRLLHIMLIMVRDGSSAEDYERRLRNRYAILTALRACGMSAEDTKHIRYFTVASRQENDLTRGVSRIDEISHDSSELTVFPYEWFEREELYPVTIHEWADDRPERVLLIWLPECVFSKQPLTRLAQLIDALGRRRSNSSKSTSYDWAKNMGKDNIIEIDLIGPSHSGTLRAMLKEVAAIQSSNYEPEDTNTVDVKSKLEDLGIFSPWSTASPALLVDDSFNEDPNAQNSASHMYKVIPKEFAKINVEFLRMIGSDDLLAIHLIQELKKRGVCPVSKKDHVALISEWDTFYGKAFPLTFAAMMESIDPNNSRLEPDWITYAKNLNRKMPGDSKHYFPENLHTYTYICGIDGVLTGSQSSEDKRSNGDAQNEKTDPLSKWTYAESLKRPIDRSQLDYVRRLAKKLSDEYNRSNKKLKAIGVVGTDVYDKLILLHALREQFSDVIFFTTDLDARLMHDEQYKWTRNVIVASNFGLELSGKYQRNIYQYWEESSFPSFRDNYQTALFFACRVALGLRVVPYKIEQVNFGQDGSVRLLSGRAVQRLYGNKMLRDDFETITQLISHPRLFEIGRDRAVDISADDSEIHPPRRDLTWTVSELIILILLVTMSFFLLLVQLNAHARKAVRLFSPMRWDLSGFGVKLAAIVSIMFVAFAIYDHYQQGGERFLLAAGVSIWPGETLRLIALILSVFFLAKSYQDLQKKEQELDKDFSLDTIHTLQPISFTKWRKSKHGSDCSKNRLISWLSYRRWISIHGWDTGEDDVDAQELWEGYLIRGTRGKRAWRIMRISIVYILFVAILMFILGSRPNVPYRGNIGRTVDLALLISSIFSMIILIFLVVDATKLSLKLVRSLKTPVTVWPEKLLNSLKKEENSKQPGAKTVRDPESSDNSLDHVYDKALAEWLDIKFIASHTEAVGKLIYYPFIILLIMFVARSRYFDNWNFPISLIIIFLLNSTCALCCGWMLRREAEKTRNIALERIGKELVKATAACDECRSKHLETMIGQIKSMRQGAYSSFAENPVLHAILIPSGGISLLTLLRFL